MSDKGVRLLARNPEPFYGITCSLNPTCCRDSVSSLSRSATKSSFAASAARKVLARSLPIAARGSCPVAPTAPSSVVELADSRLTPAIRENTLRVQSGEKEGGAEGQGSVRPHGVGSPRAYDLCQPYCGVFLERPKHTHQCQRAQLRPGSGQPLLRQRQGGVKSGTPPPAAQLPAQCALLAQHEGARSPGPAKCPAGPHMARESILEIISEILQLRV